MTLIEAKKNWRKKKTTTEAAKVCDPTEVQKRFLLRTVQYMNAIKGTSDYY